MGYNAFLQSVHQHSVLKGKFKAVAAYLQWECREWRGREEGGEVRGNEVCRLFVGVLQGAQCPLCEWGWQAGDVMAGRTKSPLSLWRHDMIGTQRRVTDIVVLNQAVTGRSFPSCTYRNTICQSFSCVRQISLYQQLENYLFLACCLYWAAYSFRKHRVGRHGAMGLSRIKPVKPCCTVNPGHYWSPQNEMILIYMTWLVCVILPLVSQNSFKLTKPVRKRLSLQADYFYLL